MSYEPTQWSAGDTVTSAKLNKMEQGIASAGGGIITGIIDNDAQTITLDKTWQEIWDNNYIIITILHDSNAKEIRIITDISGYAIHAINFQDNETLTFHVDNINDYPVCSYEGKEK